MDQILIMIGLLNPKNSNTFKPTYMDTGTINQVGLEGLLLMIFWEIAQEIKVMHVCLSPQELNHPSWIHYQLGGKMILTLTFWVGPLEQPADRRFIIIPI